MHLPVGVGMGRPGLNVAWLCGFRAISERGFLSAPSGVQALREGAGKIGDVATSKVPLLPVLSRSS